MSIVENSIFLGFFLRLWAALKDAWTDSTPARAFRWMEKWFYRLRESSVVCRVVRREGLLVRAWDGSLVHRLFSGLLNLPLTFIRWLRRVGGRIWEGSWVLRACTGLGRYAALLLGLFLLVMLVAPHGMWNNIYGLLGAVAVTAFFILGASALPRRRLSTGVMGPYLPLYLLCIVGAFFASMSSHLSLRFLFFHITAFLLVLLVVNSVDSMKQLRLILGLAVAGIAIASLYGCYQGYVGVEIDPAQQDMLLNRGMPGRIYSFFDNPNNFAELLVMLIPLDLGLLLTAKTWRGRLWSFLALLPCVASIGLTYSRSGWIGLALAVMVIIALENWKLVPVMLVLGLCAIPFLPETIYNRILTIGNMKDSSTSYRFSIYDAAENLMHDHWYQGVGLGSDVMQRAFHAYPAMFNGTYPIHTHNNYLQMWGETGIWGLLSYLTLLLYGLKAGVQTFYRSMDRQLRHILAAAIGAFCGILVIGIAEYTWFYPRNMFVYWFLFGVILTCVKLHRAQQADR